ncbi:hypothetical protein E2C01_044290 [Portunus trituberculatus]|uniref:Uncharacterized protein n=1 Tax=Portunus trituberculatus TaxID=210409 RepID=A0A5B7FSQ9_PORTR|nr:hypothetical protein [Portunus trituberculatus]
MGLVPSSAKNMYSLAFTFTIPTPDRHTLVLRFLSLAQKCLRARKNHLPPASSLRHLLPSPPPPLYFQHREGIRRLHAMRRSEDLPPLQASRHQTLLLLALSEIRPQNSSRIFEILRWNPTSTSETFVTKASRIVEQPSLRRQATDHTPLTEDTSPLVETSDH